MGPNRIKSNTGTLLGPNKQSGLGLFILLSVYLLAILAFGTLGFVMLEDYSALEALFMTVITISTVGFGEVRPLGEEGKIFTVLLIASSFMVLAVSAAYFSRLLIEGDLIDAIRSKRLEKEVKNRKNHYIVCGFGRMGRMLVKALCQAGHEVVVVEKLEPPNESFEKEFLYIQGDATEEDVLLKAGIEKAQGLIASVASDADNVFITLTARDLSPNIYILARAAEESSERKMMRAGASKVINPYVIGGQRMTQAILKPAVMDFIEIGCGDDEPGLQLEEIPVQPGSGMAGTNLRDSGIRSEVGLMIIAVKKKGERMIFNPPPDLIIEVNDVLIVLGRQEDFDKLSDILKEAPRVSGSR
jgi:voltage-gated potassium channel